MTLLLALLLDAAAGEPRWLWSRAPHPAVLMGRAVAWCDARFNTGNARRLRGIAVIAALTLAAGMLGAALSLLGPVAEILIAAILLAQRSLIDHVTAVATALRASLAGGRSAVAMIVSRDTTAMDRSAIARAAIESAAENLSDGIIAPAFWFAVAGLPGLLIYKAVNTADSMIGYRSPRYLRFGWAAARLDDVLNLIPARLTAALIALTNGCLSDWRAISRDAAKHRSPNAGWPEAALAHGLNLALAGPRSYDGTAQDFPWVNAAGRKHLLPQDIEDAAAALWRAWGAGVALAVLIALF
ncbi:MAG: adenosylcobinamide-phosphate synthase CbiB [Sediminimonas sp.]|uniref:adenosylcobinamide-phosphate synthase CbiB n=1 Tax=Sediminimonas sp. TaxID=2823379 RepID=UPI002870096C|nr:adenosylcobinamide-phosphate synthase CbiB [Sediminimonas sp.]MDR9486312.1 adenosylcobinamide-phosphate synthase CbiB [Sediminimonas sp.]